MFTLLSILHTISLNNWKENYYCKFMTKNDIKIVYMILLKQFVTFDSLIFYKNVITLQRKMNAYSQNNALFLIIDVFPSIH